MASVRNCTELAFQVDVARLDGPVFKALSLPPEVDQLFCKIYVDPVHIDYYLRMHTKTVMLPSFVAALRDCMRITWMPYHVRQNEDMRAYLGKTGIPKEPVHLYELFVYTLAAGRAYTYLSISLDAKVNAFVEACLDEEKADVDELTEMMERLSINGIWTEKQGRKLPQEIVDQISKILYQCETEQKVQGCELIRAFINPLLQRSKDFPGLCFKETTLAAFVSAILAMTCQDTIRTWRHRLPEDSNARANIRRVQTLLDANYAKRNMTHPDICDVWNRAVIHVSNNAKDLTSAELCDVLKDKIKGWVDSECGTV